MSIYQKLNDLTNRIITLEENVVTSSITASSALINTLTTSNFSASAGLANLTTLTASNFSASAGLANLTTLTASNAFISNLYFDSGGESLDSYEYGEWTPRYSGSTTEGSGSYSDTKGYYTKIGRMVFINCQIYTSGTFNTPPVGDIAIKGLPFIIANSTSNFSAGSVSGISNLNSSIITLLPKFGKNVQYIDLIRVTTDATSQATYLTGSDLKNAAGFNNEIIISGFYFTT